MKNPINPEAIDKVEHAAMLAHCLLSVQDAINSMEKAAVYANRAKDTNLEHIIRNRIGVVEEARKAVETVIREAYDEQA